MDFAVYVLYQAGSPSRANTTHTASASTMARNLVLVDLNGSVSPPGRAGLTGRLWYALSSGIMEGLPSTGPPRWAKNHVVIEGLYQACSLILASVSTVSVPVTTGAFIVDRRPSSPPSSNLQLFLM